MAAPPSVTTKAISGKFSMNKALSPGIDEILQLQGVSWLKRRAIATFTLFVDMEHTTNEAGVERVAVDQSLSGYFTSHSTRTLDWQEREIDDDTFGHVSERSRRIPVAEITDEFPNAEWTEDTIEDDVILTENWSTPDKNSTTWRAIQAWGFAMVDGKRRYVRYTTCTASDKQADTRIVYDYLGPI